MGMFDVDVPNPLSALLLGQQSYNTSVENGRRAAKEQALREASQMLGAGNRQGALQRLLSGGDLQGAALVNTMDNQAYQRGRDAAGDQRQAVRDAIMDKRWERQFAENQDYSPEELDARRQAQLKANNVDPNSQEGRNFRMSGQWTGQGTGENGLNPVMGVDTDPNSPTFGQPVIMQMNSSGKMTRTQMPPGVSASSKEPIKVDSGTHWTFIDRVTHQPIRTEPKNLAETESQKVQGDEQGKAKAALPAAQITAERTISQIDGFMKAPGFDQVFGVLDQFRPNWTMDNLGREALARFKQLSGRAFLEGRAMLKGGGAITDFESAKAEAAIARLDRSLSEKDARAALEEFKSAVNEGVSKLRAAAQGNTSRPKTNGGAIDFSEYFKGM